MGSPEGRRRQDQSIPHPVGDLVGTVPRSTRDEGLAARRRRSTAADGESGPVQPSAKPRRRERDVLFESDR